MFSKIDKTIFPDCCEVLEIVPSQHYVFPIFKCGRSSLNLEAPIQGWKTIVNEQIASAPEITVFLRDPRQRFISGVNTYVQQCLRDHPELDIDTVLFFVKKYLFLNRHYSPQLFWLINLARYSQAPLVLKDIEDVSQLTSKKSHAGIVPPNDEFLVKLKDFPWSELELYFYLDQIVRNHIGQKLTFQQLMIHIRDQHREVYKSVFGQSQEILNVLP